MSSSLLTIRHINDKGYSYVCEEELNFDPTYGRQFWHLIQVPSNDNYQLLDFGSEQPPLSTFDVRRLVLWHQKYQRLPNREDFNQISPMTVDNLISAESSLIT